MNKEQNNAEELQVLSKWKCNWSGEIILRLVIGLSHNNAPGALCDWIKTARAQDLFNTAAVLASGLHGANNYFDSAGVFRAKLNYCIGTDDIMYCSKEDSDSEAAVVLHKLIERYGRRIDGRITVGYYIDMIMNAKQLDGLQESIELVRGCDLYIQRAVEESLRKINYALSDYDTSISDAFSGDFVRTYAFISLIDVVCAALRMGSKNALIDLRETLLHNIGLTC